MGLMETGLAKLVRAKKGSPDYSFDSFTICFNRKNRHTQKALLYFLQSVKVTKYLKCNTKQSESSGSLWKQRDPMVRSLERDRGGSVWH